MLSDFQRAAPSPSENIANAEAALGVVLPKDYRAFLESGDGGEGFVGEHYLVMWRADELSRYNLEYEVSEYAKGLIGFGSNGGGEMFAFDFRFQPPPVVMVPFIGMSHEDALVVADSFGGLLERMKRDPGSLFDVGASG